MHIDHAPKVAIGNVYGHGFDAPQVAELETLGFAFRPEVSTYAGSQVCHFLDFDDGPSLELIEVSDRADYASFVPAGMEPYCPGVSLVVEGGSPTLLDAYQRDFANLEPYRLRVAYQGGAGPGWHYLNFAVPVLSGTFVWLTALDQPKPVPVKRTVHPNGVRGVIGLVFDVGSEKLERLARLTGEPVTGRKLQLGGVAVIATNAGSASSSFPLRAVVLQAASSDSLGLAQSEEATRLLGRPAVRIETNPLAWDLWVTT